MEKKYDPVHIIMGTWGRFFMDPTYSDSKAHDFNIFIEIKEEADKWYHINIIKEGAPVNLWKGHFAGADTTISGQIFHGRLQKDSETLFKNKNSLGKVYIKYRMSRIVKQYMNYEKFWEDVGR